MKSSKKVVEFYDRAIDSLAGGGAILVIAMMAVVCLEVVMRYILRRPLIWAVETSEYMLVVLTFLAATWILRSEGHVKVDFLYNRLSRKSQAVLGIFSSILGIFVCLTLLVYGTRIVWGMLRTLEVDAKSQIGMPKGPLMAVIPLCSFFLIIQFVRRAHKYLKESKRE